MANPNLSQKQRADLYPKMLKLWPEVCAGCLRTLDECNLRKFDPVTKTGGFEIHHTRYDIDLTDPSYTRFMCHGCNHKKEFSKETIMSFESEISAAHKANIVKHPIFLEWFAHEMEERNYHMPLSEAVNGGAYISGANVKTVRGWLKPLTEHTDSPFGIMPVHGVDEVYLRGKEMRLNQPNKTIETFNQAVDESFKKE
jgi:hypothetical protein